MLPVCGLRDTNKALKRFYHLLRRPLGSLFCDSARGPLKVCVIPSCFDYLAICPDIPAAAAPGGTKYQNPDMTKRCSNLLRSRSGPMRIDHKKRTAQTETWNSLRHAQLPTIQIAYSVTVGLEKCFLPYRLILSINKSAD